MAFLARREKVEGVKGKRAKESRGSPTEDETSTRGTKDLRRRIGNEKASPM